MPPRPQQPAPGPPLEQSAPRQAAPQPPSQPDPKGKPRKPWRWFLFGAGALFLVAAFASGAVLGWLAHDEVQANRAHEPLTIVEVPAEQEFVERQMPDLRGLAALDARQLLADSGFDPGIIQVREIEWAGQEGLVISHDPVVGETVVDVIALDVSSPAMVPDVVGQTQGQAAQQLRLLGAEAEVKPVFQPQERTGTVLAVEPVSGEALGEAVVLTVAEAGSSVYLGQLEQVDRICRGSESDVNGKHYPNSTSCSPGYNEEEAMGFWLLNRNAMAITGVVGVDDKGDPLDVARVRFIGDGTELANITVAYAQPQELSIDVEGVLRLEVAVTSATGTPVALADVLVKGTDQQIAALVASR